MHTLIIVPGKISNTRSFYLDHTCSQIGQVPCGQWRGNSLFKSNYKNTSQWPFQKRLHSALCSVAICWNLSSNRAVVPAYAYAKRRFVALLKGSVFVFCSY